MYGANICKLVKSVYAHKMENCYIQLGIFYLCLINSKTKSRIKEDLSVIKFGWET